VLIDKHFGRIDIIDDDENLLLDTPWASPRRAGKGNLVARPAHSDPVRSKFSCGSAIVESQHASQSLARLDLTCAFADSVRRRWKENHIPFPLVISFTVKMKNVI
jgi:hypothetical protein